MLIILFLLLLLPCWASDCGCSELKRDAYTPLEGEMECELETEMNSETAAGEAFGPHDVTFLPHQLVKVLGGEFIMGTNEKIIPQDKEGPERKVKVGSFLMDAYEVSVGQFLAFVRNTSFTTETEGFGWSFVLDRMLTPKLMDSQKGYAGNAPWWRGIEGADWIHPEGPGSSVFKKYPKWPLLREGETVDKTATPEGFEKVKDKYDNVIDTTEDTRINHPVVHVTWNDAVAFCQWRGMELPTEAEYEYAERGGLVRKKYAWGNTLLIGGAHMTNIWQGDFPNVNTGDDGWMGTSPINAFPPNGYGLYNTAGNVWEWTSTDFDVTPGDKVKKGGSFMCHKSYCFRYRAAARAGNTPDTSAANIGFRCIQRIKD